LPASLRLPCPPVPLDGPLDAITALAPSVAREGCLRQRSRLPRVRREIASDAAQSLRARAWCATLERPGDEMLDDRLQRAAGGPCGHCEDRIEPEDPRASGARSW